MKGYEKMKFSKITALICTLSFITSTSVSAVGNIIPDTNDFQIQTGFIMNQSEEINRYRDYICDSVDIEKDIIFASKKDYQNNNIDLALDLYQPLADSEESRPIIIFVHGGGMYTGSKDSDWDITVELAEDFAMKGYVCIAIDYRLNPEWEETGAFTETMKNASEDVASAVEWVRENADEYKINPDCIALAGYSSGAEIIDNMYFSNYLVDEKDFDKNGIKAVISISGNRLLYILANISAISCWSLLLYLFIVCLYSSSLSIFRFVKPV